MGERVLRSRFQAGGDAQDFHGLRRELVAEIMAPVRRNDFREGGLADGEGASLVHSYDVYRSCALQVRAALDEDAAPRRASNRGKDGGRGADDQRAGRGDHHDGHRPVECRAEGFAPEQPWHEEYADGEKDDPHRIPLLRFLKEALGAGFLRLRLGDELHHARQRRILRALRHSQLDAAALVDRARKKRAAGVLRNRH